MAGTNGMMKAHVKPLTRRKLGWSNEYVSTVALGTMVRVYVYMCELYVCVCVCVCWRERVKHGEKLM